MATSPPPPWDMRPAPPHASPHAPPPAPARQPPAASEPPPAAPPRKSRYEPSYRGPRAGIVYMRADARTRPCLRCGRDFDSEGNHNRLCDNCRSRD